MASWGSGWLALRQGHLPRALSLLERAIGICQDADIVFGFPAIAAALGEAYILGGRADAAVPLLTQGWNRQLPAARWFQALCLLPLGEAHMLAGRMEEAHTLAERAWRTPVHTRNGATRPKPCGSSARLRRGASLRRSEPAEVHYRQALALAEELGMRPLQAHCHRGLGTVYATTGQQEQARAELSAAIALYRAMDMTFWLPQTEAALARVIE